MDGSRLINSEMSDKMLAMEFCEKLIRVEGKDLRSMFWVKQDEKGHHWYEVFYTVQHAN